jgi:pyruvate-formate lyase-activating enzyme
LKLAIFAFFKDDMDSNICKLKEQGFSQGDCLVKVHGTHLPACQVTLNYNNGQFYRRITAIHLSRPENYLSIYQSGCNFSCRKCHSWYFSKVKNGSWYSPNDILTEAVDYEKSVTLIEPRERATAWHAHDTCRCCGSCILYGKRSSSCPGILDPESIVLGPQGFGPVRNIVGFTGGDLTCNPEFYGECARLIHQHTGLWVLIETNGYGLTLKNLDYLQDSGVDAFWLDIKAYDDDKHKWLTGCSNDNILKLPKEILKRGFVLEVLSLFIPDLVESDELENIAQSLMAVDDSIPFTILAFFPEYRMKGYKSPSVKEIVEAYHRVKETGLKNIRIGNIGVFARTKEDQEYLVKNVNEGAY